LKSATTFLMFKMRRRNKIDFTRTTSFARMVIELVMVVLIPINPVVSTSQPCGSLRCENGGKCMDLSVTATSSSSSLSDLQASGKLLLQCLCPPGYGGVTCSYYHGKLCSEKGDSTCSDGSSYCIPNSLNSNVTECPCDIAYSISPFAGQMCESPETEYCLPVWSHEPSRQFFCTNGGRCFGGGGSSSTTIQEESDTWGMVMSDTPITCQCRKYSLTENFVSLVIIVLYNRFFALLLVLFVSFSHLTILLFLITYD
jgi:hypothetical protein